LATDLATSNEASYAAALETLKAIDAGEMPVELLTQHGSDHHPEFRAANGWSFRVFDDCGDWDFVSAIAPVTKPWHTVPVFPLASERAVFFFRPEHLERWGWVRDGVSPGGYVR
jgi:hypothetical protein